MDSCVGMDIRALAVAIIIVVIYWMKVLQRMKKKHVKNIWSFQMQSVILISSNTEWFYKLYHLQSMSGYVLILTE